MVIFTLDLFYKLGPGPLSFFYVYLFCFENILLSFIFFPTAGCVSGVTHQVTNEVECTARYFVKASGHCIIGDLIVCLPFCLQEVTKNCIFFFWKFMC